MKSCPSCSSIHIRKNGTRSSKGLKFQKLICNDCKKSFSGSIENEKEEEVFSTLSLSYKRDLEWIEQKTKSQRYVITSAQSNTDIDEIFLSALLSYVDFNQAELLIIPIRYKNPTSQQENNVSHVYPSMIEEFLFENNIRLHKKLKVLGSLKIAATTEHPLTGLAPVTKGDSIIVGHNQLQSTTLPVQIDDLPVIMTTTGTISSKNYSVSKQGYKAEFNHSASAVVVELDDDIFHIRHLNFDGEGFYDLDHYYSDNKDISDNNEIYALITGDEHAIFACEHVKASTYGLGGICDILHPKYIVRHDVLDCHSVSHHHKRDFLTRFKKGVKKQNLIENELNLTIDFIVDTTPEDSINIIISSNHNDHLKHWLNECDTNKEPWNAKIYHFLMYEMLTAIEADPEEIPNPFELWFVNQLNDNNKTIFLKRTQSFKMFDIEIAAHGDIGANGSRGSRDSFANLPSKCIIGHSHSPGIEKGVYQVGTSSKLKLDYNEGPSSWLNTHAIIYPNGKRQLINIIKGKWRK